VRPSAGRGPSAPFALSPYLFSIGLVAAATAAARAIEEVVLPSNLSPVFLIAVMISALRFGLWPSVATSTLSILSWNYFFLPPRFSLAIQDPQDLLALILFLVVSLVVSNLAAHKLRQGEAIAARSRAMAELYDFSRKIAAASSGHYLLAVAAQAIGSMLNGGVAMMLSRDGELQPATLHPEAAHRDPASMAQEDIDAATRVWRDSVSSDAPAPAEATGDWVFLPLRTPRGAYGVVGLHRHDATPIAAEELRLFSVLAGQTADALERTRLADAIDQARLEAETERMRSAMLTSLSHDLRTPLTTIIAVQSTLIARGESCNAATRMDMLERAQAEAERLDRFIGNLLDMTRLESGALNIRLEPIDVAEAVESTLCRTGAITAAHCVAVTIPDDLPMVKADFLLLEQVLFNLIDNAARYAPPATAIAICAQASAGSVEIEVVDEGPGIPAAALETIFNKFTRVSHEDRTRPGTGLGLAICRGFLGAMSGAIRAANRIDRSGARFIIRLQRA
jgi:two-component system sensor histidine kinase KdpD